MASRKKTKKRTTKKSSKPRATRAKKTTRKSRKSRKKSGTRRLWGAALQKHNEKLARMGKPPVQGAAPAAPTQPVPKHKRVKAPPVPGYVKRPVTPPKRHRAKMVPAAEFARVKIATEAKHAVDELAKATKELKKVKTAVATVRTRRGGGRKKFGKRQKAAAAASFKERHGMSPAAYIRSKRSARTERKVTAKELLAKPGTKTAVKSATRASATLKGKKLHVWLCAGPHRTGCGGGKKGGHVIGMLR